MHATNFDCTGMKLEEVILNSSIILKVGKSWRTIGVVVVLSEQFCSATGLD